MPFAPRRTPLLCLLLVAACQDRGPSPAAAPPPPPQAPYTSDSARQAELAAFRAGLTPVRNLEGGEPSREALVRRFVAALGAQDTAALRRLQLSRAEFAWLYYPTTPQALPPYDLDSGTLWFTLQAQGSKGLANALGRLGGKAIQFVAERCEGSASREGENTVYGPCLVRIVTPPSDTSEGRLFGLVLERGGRWKFVTLSNELD